MSGWLGRLRGTGRADDRAAQQQAAIDALAARLDELADGGGDAWAGQLRQDQQAMEQRLREFAARMAEVERQVVPADGAHAMADRIGAADERLGRLERALDGVLPLLTSALVRRLEAEAVSGDPAALAVALDRLDRQLSAHIADADRTSRALVDRIERVRRSPA